MIVKIPDEFPPPAETWPIIEHEPESEPIVPPDLSLSLKRRAMPWLWAAVSLPFIYLGDPAAVLGCFIMARLHGMENVAYQRAMVFSWQSDMVARRIFEKLP